ncbi:RagB/SusD family nutrient uptake outer membrane protein [Flavobacterium orientale]|uniref:Outer membrane protein n=1 Tax=Flavobacterium orientale TaxID=1756020 RepID=A0A916XXH2_9FLAO|nr:RagB/SusD family nutrient uptake outer membrane protein [Flavobacterium orientale]GGD19879.1 outer membrane protein [Flavobacterium orientale]
MKKIKILSLLGFAFFMQSCEDDLNVVPEDPNQISVEQFYSQDGAYTQAIAGVYGNLSLTGTLGPDNSNIGGVDAGTSQYGRVLWYLQNLSTDEVIWSYENDPGTREIQRNIWNSSNPVIRGMFSRAMFQVALANEFLRQSTADKLNSRGITGAQTLSEIEEYRNEARALRALSYYHLLDLFGKAPFNTEDDVVGVAGPEYNAQQLFDFVEAELTTILPNLKPAGTNIDGRLDQGFARMVLAKLYLNAEVYIGQNRYNDCADQCIAIIGSGYSLATNYLNNFNADNNTSPEAIFYIQADGLVTQNYGPTTVMINGQVGSIESNGNQFGVGGWGGALRLRKQFVQKFDGNEFNNDVRNTIISGVRDIEITDIANRDQGYILAKFSNISSAGVPGISTTFVDTDFPMFRLADVYLMYAECALRGASSATLPQAVTYVNALRERANNGSQIGNISQSNLTLDFIIDERSRELHWEGHRRQDLIRFNRYTGGNYNWAWKGNGSNGVSIPSFLKLYPIPQASLASNPNLTQNPGY